MTEELYVINDGKRYSVDLNSPSGISLKFQSALLGDLSKITANHSYSFTIPFTQNNKRVFAFLEDMRVDSPMFGKKIQAEYRRNGIPIFTNGNLYIQSLSEGYSAVFTWDICDGFAKIRENDISLRELPIDGYAEIVKKFFVSHTEFYNDLVNFEDYTAFDKEFDNEKDYLNPHYLPCGISKPEFKRICGPVLPVIPIRKILLAIQDHFGISFNFGEHKTTATKDFSKEPAEPIDIVDYGVLPLVSRNEESTLDKRTVNFLRFDTASEPNNTWVGSRPSDYREDYKYFQYLIGESDDDDADSLEDDEDAWNAIRPIIKLSADNVDNEYVWMYDGKIHVKKDCTINLVLQVRTEMSVQPMVKPSFKALPVYLWHRKGVRVDSVSGGIGGYWYNLADKIEPVRATYEEDGRIDYYKWDAEITIEAIEGDEIFCTDGTPEDEDDVVYKHHENLENQSMGISIVAEGNPLVGGYPISIKDNLPDISCFNFLKALFFAMGGFPVMRNDVIDICSFDELNNNIGKSRDWSKKILSSMVSVPHTEFSISGMAQESYYLMANEGFDNKKETEDKWVEPKVKIDNKNGILDKRAALFEFPFYPCYYGNTSCPEIDWDYIKYNTPLLDGVKQWDIDYENKFTWYIERKYSVKPIDASPTIGLIYQVRESSMLSTRAKWLQMIVWSVDMTLGYKVLKQFLDKPFVIEEDVDLTTIEVLNIDYAKPVYISEYNSYFGIISIDIAENDVCKVKLVRLNV